MPAKISAPKVLIVECSEAFQTFSEGLEDANQMCFLRRVGRFGMVRSSESNAPLVVDKRANYTPYQTPVHIIM